MTPLNPIEFFIVATAAEVRQMPVSDARNYLCGLLALVGPDAQLDPLREIYRHLDVGDSQLELLAAGQLKLNLDSKQGKDGNGSEDGK